MRTAIVPAGNMADLSEIPPHMRERIKIQPVQTMQQVLALALVRALPQNKSAIPAAHVRAAKVVTPARRGGAA
jgi:ATP-dependent Lon protease